MQPEQPVLVGYLLTINQKFMSPKNILLGVSGGIAAYKCPELIRRLKERGFDLRVVITSAAKEFVSPMALQAVSGHQVHQELFDAQMEAAMGHIELARWADLILIAPATANTIAKLTHGEADDLLTTLVLASQAPVFLAPAMNQQMWNNQATQDNLQQLTNRGMQILGPDSGEQACGEVGEGRMLQPEDIAQKIHAISANAKLLDGQRVLITAGPTREAIDPVRYLTNHSSGKMGYALANAAYQAGAQVTLVSGPTNLSITQQINKIEVTSAQQMFTAVKENLPDKSIFIGCAAVADYAPVEVANQKIKKNDQQVTLSLKPNPDILAWVASQTDRPFVVGFAAESHSVKEFATAKLTKKNLDMICANDISNSHSGFNSNDNQILLLDKNGREKLLPLAKKDSLAQQIIAEIASQLSSASLMNSLENGETD